MPNGTRVTIFFVLAATIRWVRMSPACFREMAPKVSLRIELMRDGWTEESAS
jgi:hypothetical protein